MARETRVTMNVTLNEGFVAAVKSGKTDWKKSDFDSIGIGSDWHAKNAAGILNAKRWGNGKTSHDDIVKIDVDGTCVTLHGTSNLTEEEYIMYDSAPSSSSGTRTATIVAAKSENLDMARKLLDTWDWSTVSHEQASMLLELAHASEVARNLFKTFDFSKVTKEQLSMLLGM